MVNVFMVHSGRDYDYVKRFVEPYLTGKLDEDGNAVKRSSYSNILTLKSGKRSNWKKDALRKIKMAQVVVVVLGEDSNEDSKAETMGWEVSQAVKYNKQIMILNPKHFEIPKYLFCKDRFTKQEQPVAPEQTICEIKKRIDDFGKGYYNIFSTEYEQLPAADKAGRKSELLDQYKMFQKSSEDLVSRRQSVNSFYISVNSALVALMGVVMGVVEAPAKLYVMFFMSITGIILDISWINILDAYGTLNAAKMKVINLMERKLPVALYDVEWRVMSDKLNNKKYVSFTNSEKRIPRIFSVVYSAILVVLGIYLLVKHVL